MDLIQERVLPIISTIGNQYRVRALDNNEHSISIPIAQFFKERYRGKAYTTTVPGISQVGDWYHCAEDGVFTNFGGQTANEFDRFYFNGATWDLLPYSDLVDWDFDYLTLEDVDPTSIPTPPTGFYNVGIYNGAMWIKDANGDISYVASDIASEAIEATTDPQLVFNLTRAPGSGSVVFHNGSALPPNGWSAVGTTLTLVGPAYTKDLIQVIY